MNNDRIFVSHDYRDGSVEVFWSARASGIGWPEDRAADGAILIDLEGAGRIQTRLVGYDDDTVLAVHGKDGLRLYLTEDYTDQTDESQLHVGKVMSAAREAWDLLGEMLTMTQAPTKDEVERVYSELAAALNLDQDD